MAVLSLERITSSDDSLEIGGQIRSTLTVDLEASFIKYGCDRFQGQMEGFSPSLLPQYRKDDGQNQCDGDQQRHPLTEQRTAGEGCKK